MRVIQFEIPGARRRVGVVDGDTVFDLTSVRPGMTRVHQAFAAARYADQPLESVQVELVRPWRTATLVASCIAGLELVLLVVLGVIVLGRSVAPQVRAAAAKAAQTPKHHVAPSRHPAKHSAPHAARLLSETAYADPDVVRVAMLAATQASDEGQVARAVDAYTIVREQWVRAGRADRVAAVESAIQALTGARWGLLAAGCSFVSVRAPSKHVSPTARA